MTKREMARGSQGAAVSSPPSSVVCRGGLSDFDHGSHGGSAQPKTFGPRMTRHGGQAANKR
jgi:hypothetical protein